MKISVHYSLKEALPNLLTVTRLIAGLWFLHSGSIPPSRTQLILLLLAVMTDVFDGRIARALGTTSSFGAILDTLSDKTFVLCLLAQLSISARLPYPLLIVILVQYVLIPIGGFLCWRRFSAVPLPSIAGTHRGGSFRRDDFYWNDCRQPACNSCCLSFGNRCQRSAYLGAIPLRSPLKFSAYEFAFIRSEQSHPQRWQWRHS
ncbi:CDP-alcohol phosphatidyltransferase family protein [Candidatus Poribacteria bacterium]|nr:CDP-alcohol phosphatidyltransferase family protein [Candidatus Poribacteria bacterium]